MRFLALSGLLVALSAGRAVSQRLPTPLASARTQHSLGAAIPAQVSPEPGIPSPLLAAAGLGLLGWGVGALTGYAVKGDCFEEFCGFEEIFYGGAAGGGLGVAVGAHLGNRRRGSFALDLLTSRAVWGLGYAVMRSVAHNSGGAGPVLPGTVVPPT